MRKTPIILGIILAASSALAGLWYVNLPAQTIQSTKPAQIGATYNPTLAECVAAGWRGLTNRYVAPDGWRIVSLCWSQDVSRPMYCQEYATIANIAAEQAAAAQAASNAAAQAAIAAAVARSNTVAVQKARINDDPVLKTICAELVRCSAARQSITVAAALTILTSNLASNVEAATP